MHEMPIVQNLLQAAIEKASEHGARKITRIFLSLGEASGVNEESFRHYFDRCAHSTIAEDAQLNFNKVPGKVHCLMCDCRQEISNMLDECPRCGMSDIRIEPNREISVGEIEIQV